MSVHRLFGETNGQNEHFAISNTGAFSARPESNSV